MLDLNTLRLIAMVSFLGFAFATLTLWRLVPQERSLRDWAAASASLALGMLLLGLRGTIPDLFSIVIANTLTVLGIGFVYVGTRNLFYAGSGYPWHWLAAGAAFLTCLFAPNLSVRVVVTSLLYSPFFIASAWLFWRNRGEALLEVVERLAALVFVAGAALFIFRAINPPSSLPVQSVFIKAPSWIEALPYLYAILFSIWLSLTLMLIVSVRLQQQRAEALERAEHAIYELRESEFRWKFAIDGAGDGLWDWNMADNTVFFSRRWKEMLGFAENEIGSGLAEWESRIHPDDKTLALATLQSYLDGKVPVYSSEHRVRCKDGSYKWIHDRGMVVERGENGNPLRMIGTHTDITERKQMESQVRQLAFYDPLTQLPNRRLLNDRLTQVISANKRRDVYGAVMFIDLDNFKPLNDTYGHGVGDLLLLDAAGRLKNCVREMDTVARFGGDEFVVLLSELDGDKSESNSQARMVAEKIRAALSAPYRLTINSGRENSALVEHCCTASIGVVVFLSHDGSQENILASADVAMYQAKESGRNSIRFYGDSV